MRGDRGAVITLYIKYCHIKIFFFFLRIPPILE